MNAVEVSQQQTLTVIHQVSKDHEKASKAAAELKTLLETAKQEVHQTKVLLQQTSNNLEEQSYSICLRTKELDDKIEEENQKLLKGNKALSRATSNLETLKRRVASLEDEKVKFLSTLHDLKAEADDKNHEGYGLREELAKVKDECDSLKNVHAQLTRAQDDLDNKTDKVKVVSGQKMRLEKMVNKLLIEIDQLKEDQELEMACLFNQLHLEKSIISIINPEEEELETENESQN